MVSSMEKIESNFFDFCSGIGGGRLGFEKNGLNCIGHCEVEKTANEVYDLMFEKTKNYGDITELDATTLPDFKYMVAGFPCQSFSIVGKRKGLEDDRGTIIYNLINILRLKKPKYFLFENVKGLVNHDKGKTLKKIIEELDSIGYEVYYKVLNSVDFGVPQSRERIYIVGIDKAINNEKFNFPQINKKSELNKFLSPTEEFEFNKENKIFIKYLNNKYNLGKYDIDKILKKDFIVLDTRQSDLRIYENKIPTLRAGRHGILYTYNNKLYKLSAKESLLLQGFTEKEINKLKDYKIIEGKILTKSGNAMTVNVIEEIVRELVKYDEK